MGIIWRYRKYRSGCVRRIWRHREPRPQSG